MTEFLDSYFDQYRQLAFGKDIYEPIQRFRDLAAATRDKGGKMMFAGNGASASLSEHGAVDFTKQGGVRSITFHDPNLITCFANDFGYDHWMAKAIEHHAKPEDAVVLIKRERNLAVRCQCGQVCTFRLPAGGQLYRTRRRQSAQGAFGCSRFIVPSHAYNVVESIHGIWLTAAIDLMIGEAVYETRAVAI